MAIHASEIRLPLATLLLAAFMIGCSNPEEPGEAEVVFDKWVSLNSNNGYVRNNGKKRADNVRVKTRTCVEYISATDPSDLEPGETGYFVGATRDCGDGLAHFAALVWIHWDD